MGVFIEKKENGYLIENGETDGSVWFAPFERAITNYMKEYNTKDEKWYLYEKGNYIETSLKELKERFKGE